MKRLLNKAFLITSFFVPILLGGYLMKIHFSGLYRNKSSLKKISKDKYGNSNKQDSNYANLINELRTEKYNYTNAILSNSKTYNEYNKAFSYNLNYRNNKKHSFKTKIKVANTSIKLEIKNIDFIQNIILTHRYNYESYLRKNNLIIPTLTTNKNSSNSSNYAINSNEYQLERSDVNINSLSLGSEENIAGFKSIYKLSINLKKIVFNPIKIDYSIFACFSSKSNKLVSLSSQNNNSYNQNQSNQVSGFIPSNNSGSNSTGFVTDMINIKKANPVSKKTSNFDKYFPISMIVTAAVAVVGTVAYVIGAIVVVKLVKMKYAIPSIPDTAIPTPSTTSLENSLVLNHSDGEGMSGKIRVSVSGEESPVAVVGETDGEDLLAIWPTFNRGLEGFVPGNHSNLGTMIYDKSGATNEVYNMYFGRGNSIVPEGASNLGTSSTESLITNEEDEPESGSWESLVTTLANGENEKSTSPEVKKETSGEVVSEYSASPTISVSRVSLTNVTSCEYSGTDQSDDGIINDENDGVINDQNDGVINDENDGVINDENDGGINDQNDSIINDENDGGINDQNDGAISNENTNKIPITYDNNSFASDSMISISSSNSDIHTASEDAFSENILKDNTGELTNWLVNNKTDESAGTSDTDSERETSDIVETTTFERTETESSPMWYYENAAKMFEFMIQRTGMKAKRSSYKFPTRFSRFFSGRGSSIDDFESSHSAWANILIQLKRGEESQYISRDGMPSPNNLRKLRKGIMDKIIYGLGTVENDGEMPTVRTNQSTFLQIIKNVFGHTFDSTTMVKSLTESNSRASDYLSLYISFLDLYYDFRNDIDAEVKSYGAQTPVIYELLESFLKNPKYSPFLACDEPLLGYSDYINEGQSLEERGSLEIDGGTASSNEARDYDYSLNYEQKKWRELFDGSNINDTAEGFAIPANQTTILSPDFVKYRTGIEELLNSETVIDGDEDSAVLSADRSSTREMNDSEEFNMNDMKRVDALRSIDAKLLEYGFDRNKVNNFIQLITKKITDLSIMEIQQVLYFELFTTLNKELNGWFGSNIKAIMNNLRTIVDKGNVGLFPEFMDTVSINQLTRARTSEFLELLSLHQKIYKSTSKAYIDREYSDGSHMYDFLTGASDEETTANESFYSSIINGNSWNIFDNLIETPNKDQISLTRLNPNNDLFIKICNTLEEKKKLRRPTDFWSKKRAFIKQSRETTDRDELVFIAMEMQNLSREMAKYRSHRTEYLSDYTLLKKIHSVNDDCKNTGIREKRIDTFLSRPNYHPDNVFNPIIHDKMLLEQKDMERIQIELARAINIM